MQFSRKTDYGLILIAALAPTYRSANYVSLRDVAERQRLPFAFLEKLAGTLKKHGVVGARKGAQGGYRLLRDPKSITFAEVIRMFEESPMMRCLRSPHPEKYCPLVSICPTRSKWREIEQEVNAIFERITVASISTSHHA